jgi:quercetin dioxygenase-like cupin family protein
VFKYKSRPITRPKEFDLLSQSDLIVAGVQTVGEGGETNLHSHPHIDGFWFVLRGRARFYTTGDEVVADLGPYEGIHIPRNFRYWFEGVGEDNLEILQVQASDRSVSTVFGSERDRLDHAPPRQNMEKMRTDFAGRLRGAREQRQET